MIAKMIIVCETHFSSTTSYSNELLVVLAVVALSIAISLLPLNVCFSSESNAIITVGDIVLHHFKADPCPSCAP